MSVYQTQRLVEAQYEQGKIPEDQEEIELRQAPIAEVEQELSEP